MLVRLRRLLALLASRSANRHFIFALAATSVLSAKSSHVYAHLAALSTEEVIRWGISFYTQDVAFLLLLRLLLDRHIFLSCGALHHVAPVAASLWALLMLVLVSMSSSFLILTGSELHWRNAVLATDSSSWSTLLTGLVWFCIVAGMIILLSWIYQDLCFIVAGQALDLLKWPVIHLASLLHRPEYDRLAQDDIETPRTEWFSEKFYDYEEPRIRRAARTLWPVLPQLLMASTLLCMGVISYLRPNERSYIFLSWTLPLVPLIDFTHSTTKFPAFSPNGRDWSNLTAVAEPMALTWLPSKTPLMGFEDWYNATAQHYNPFADPLKISNLHNEVIPEVQQALPDIDIEHIVLIKMESTRKDVFPLKKGGFIWEQLAKTFDDKEIPADVHERLATLTRTAEFLTGDYSGSAAPVGSGKKRGGINAKNALTTSTYTLKSLSGTLCGLGPLVADFNGDVDHHVYQPCMAQILAALDAVDPSSGDRSSSDFTSKPWRPSFMMSVTESFDRQELLMPKLGYATEATVSKEYLRGERGTPKFGNVTAEDVNYYGMAEVVLEDYIRDAFRSAKHNQERVFLTHLTSSTHHPFGLPKKDSDYEYVPLSGDSSKDSVSRYLNAIGYVDRWLGKILDILDEENMSNQTLVIFVGDHGLSVAENGGITPYYQPNIGNFHVPLVLSHPQLPAIDIDDPVTSSQILPTVLDLLIETGSVSNPQNQALRSLLPLYEGQSLIRPLYKAHPESGQANWQFTVMNPGRAEVSLRDARYPEWRLIVPVSENVEWRFTHLGLDPHEEKPIQGFEMMEFIRKVEARYTHSNETKEHVPSQDSVAKGPNVGDWIKEGADVVRWWVQDNNRRWRFNG